MSLLRDRQLERARNRRKAWEATRIALRRELKELIPGMEVILFGSIVDADRFCERSDIDLALPAVPQSMSQFRLIGELEERLGRRVDVVILEECRFGEKIVREGERWMVSG